MIVNKQNSHFRREKKLKKIDEFSMAIAFFLSKIDRVKYWNFFKKYNFHFETKVNTCLKGEKIFEKNR